MLDLLLRNGTVHTMDRGRPRAHSIGIWHGRVVGVDEQVTDLSALQVVDLAGATDLAGLAGVLADASAVVTGNTGPAHLAAAVGTPVVSLFAPVVSARNWAPWRVPVRLLGDQDVACAGCRARLCPFPGQPCTADVTPADAADAVDAIARQRCPA